MDKYTLALLLILVPATVFGYQPITRYDVVPYQCIDSTAYPSGFNFGVVAFSKSSITAGGGGSISCAIASGTATYTGSSPLTDSDVTMSLNSRTNVWEYYVTINPTDFSSDGTFTVTCTVTDDDTNSRALPALTLNVDYDGTCLNHYAYADAVSGNDASCNADDAVNKCQTIETAISKAQAANGGSSDGNIIYVEEGTYAVGSNSTSTTNEWLTIEAASGAAQASVILDDGGSAFTTSLLHLKGLTAQSSSGSDYVVTGANTTYIWVDDCRLLGAGRHTANSNPVRSTGKNGGFWVTDTYMYNVDYGIPSSTADPWYTMARNVSLELIGNDAFANTLLVINATVDDIDPGSTGWHSDVYQAFTTANVSVATNRIVYGVRATDAKYQGVFMRTDDDEDNLNDQGQDVALVNVFVDHTNAARDTVTGIYGAWDHLLMWHNSYPGKDFVHNEDGGDTEFTNSSFVGNLFWQFVDNTTAAGSDPAWCANGNASGNECLQNHYIYSCVDQGSCNTNEPHTQSKSPDSGSPATDTYGTANILSNSRPMPESGSALIDRISSTLISIDSEGTSRDATPDTGAYEYINLSGTGSTGWGAGGGSMGWGAGGGSLKQN